MPKADQAMGQRVDWVINLIAERVLDLGGVAIDSIQNLTPPDFEGASAFDVVLATPVS